MAGVDSIQGTIAEYFETLGFQTVPDNGRRVIRSFTSVEDEVQTLYSGVGLRDISNYGIIELRGADVLDYLNRISTNSLIDLPKEAIMGTLFTTEKGRLIDVALIANFDDYQLLFCNSENKLRVKGWLDKYVITDDVKTIDANEKYRLLEVLGPQADSFMTLICGSIVNIITVNSFKVISAEGILFFLLKIMDDRGNIKFWVLADQNNSIKLINYMIENKGPFDFNLIGEEAYESYRIERGFPASPNEINDQLNPHELKLLKYIDFSKGCYIGQEVIARLETYDKVQKFLMGIKFHRKYSEEGKYTLYDNDGAEAGNITSQAYSYKCKNYIGLAFIKKAFCEQGKELIAKSNSGEEIPVTVHDLPFKK